MNGYRGPVRRSHPRPLNTTPPPPGEFINVLTPQFIRSNGGHGGRLDPDAAGHFRKTLSSSRRRRRLSEYVFLADGLRVPEAGRRIGGLIRPPGPVANDFERPPGRPYAAVGIVQRPLAVRNTNDKRYRPGRQLQGQQRVHGQYIYINANNWTTYYIIITGVGIL